MGLKKNFLTRQHRTILKKKRYLSKITMPGTSLMGPMGGAAGKYARPINMGIKNRRGNPSAERVVFKEMMPLALRNHVKSRGAVANTKVCMEEMMSLMDCLGKYNQDKAMCAKEITAFEKCSHQAKIKNEALKESSKKMPVGPKAKVSSEHMNAYMKKFPQSGRNHISYIDPKWTK